MYGFSYILIIYIHQWISVLCICSYSLFSVHMIYCALEMWTHMLLMWQLLFHHIKGLSLKLLVQQHHLLVQISANTVMVQT